MKKFTKLAALALCLILVISTLAGCGTPAGSGSTAASGTGTSTPAEAGKIDTSEHLTLKMYLIGDRAADFDAVYSEINKILEEKLNASVEVEFLTWGEHATKYSLLFSSQEEFDLIFTATSWGHYEQTVALGGFYPLSEEFLNAYAPDIMKTLPQIAWDQAKINGEIYMVPQNFTEIVQNSIAVRGDLMEKYGVKEIKTYDEMVSFYKTIAENEKGTYATQGGPFWEYFQSKGMDVTSGAPKNGTLFLYPSQDPSDLEFKYLLDWDGYTEYCKQAKELADAGCWSRDILSNPPDRQTGFLNGNVATMAWNLGSCRTYAMQANAEHPDWNATVTAPSYDMPKSTTPYINSGMAININSQHKERAMMVVNEFYTNPAIQDLAKLGIEGKHWEAVGDNQYKLLDQAGYVAGNNCDWGWRNEAIFRTEFIENKTPLDETYDKTMADWKANLKKPHPYDGFTFNTNDVATQMAAVDAAIGTYYDPLYNGLVDDVDATLAEFKEALENAGVREILAELEKQAAAYVASKQ